MEKEYLYELLDNDHIKNTVKNILTDSFDDRKTVMYLYSRFKNKKYNLKESILNNIRGENSFTFPFGLFIY